MSYSEMIRIIQEYQENSDIPFDIHINHKNKTIKIEYTNKNEINN